MGQACRRGECISVEIEAPRSATMHRFVRPVKHHAGAQLLRPGLVPRLPSLPKKKGRPHSSAGTAHESSDMLCLFEADRKTACEAKTGHQVVATTNVVPIIRVLPRDSALEVNGNGE